MKIHKLGNSRTLHYFHFSQTLRFHASIQGREYFFERQDNKIKYRTSWVKVWKIIWAVLSSDSASRCVIPAQPAIPCSVAEQTWMLKRNSVVNSAVTPEPILFWPPKEYCYLQTIDTHTPPYTHTYMFLNSCNSQSNKP